MINLERQCASAAHWTDGLYRQLLRAEGYGPQRVVLVVEAPVLAESDSGQGAAAYGEVLGFLVARGIAHEWELENIVVAPNAQRQGLGRTLVEALLARVKQADGEAVFLEVRVSNTPARELYEKAGFKPTGFRKSYYMGPMEDAVLYRYEFG
jgi:ribosomal-protein-alanine acetyltransferase